MKGKRLHLFFIIILLGSFSCFAQQQAKNPPASRSAVNSSAQPAKSTPAFAEVLLRKTELESMLEDFSETYTDDYPKVKETRYQLSLIEKDLAKLLSFGSSDLSRLTLALGKLLVRRAELNTALWSLKTRFGDDHPDVKSAARRVSTFEKAVAEILP
jgi:hypothetical protein